MIDSSFVIDLMNRKIYKPAVTDGVITDWILSDQKYNAEDIAAEAYHQDIVDIKVPFSKTVDEIKIIIGENGNLLNEYPV